jgi:hypothetical protein
MSRQPQRRGSDHPVPTDDAARGRRSSAARRRALSVALSLATHALILIALLSIPAKPPRVFDPQPITVELVDEQSPAPAPAPRPAPRPAASHAHATHHAHAKPQVHAKSQVHAKTQARAPAHVQADSHAQARHPPAKALARRATMRPAPTPSSAESESEDEVAAAAPNPELSESQLAGAASAEAGESGGGDGIGGGGGGVCNMAARLQGVLRRDPLVHTAVANYSGKAVMVWDGDWVWFPGDIGRGLTAVRQAMAFEIAFAPAACRSRPMHGLVIFSVNAAHGPVRIAVGLGEWRWSDLLVPHPGGGSSSR